MSEDMTRAEAEKRTHGGHVGRVPFNPERCVEPITGDLGWRSRQCERKPGHGPDGLYCKQHDPAERARRRQASIDKFNRKIASDREWRKWSALRDASLDELRAEIARREGKS